MSTSIIETGPTFPHAVKDRSLLEVARGVFCLRQPLVNVYFIGHPHGGDGSWVLLDTGLPMMAEQVRGTAAFLYGERARPGAIILTHGHFDHVGGLPRLAEEWDVPVFAHEHEWPYLTGKSSYPPPDPAVGGGGMSFLSRIFPRGPIDLGDRIRPLPADGSVPFMAGWRWLATPGHSPGHVSFFRETDRVLIVGDAFVTCKQESALDALLMQMPHVRRPPAYFTSDWNAARRSVQALAQLRPDVAAAGHGQPMYGQRMRTELDELVRHWDKVALPSYGRYVGKPAVTDEHGVVSVPPAVLDPQMIVAAGIGLAAVAGGLALLRRPRPRNDLPLS